MPIDSGLKSQILRLSQTVVFESVHNKVFVIATSEPIHEAKSVHCSTAPQTPTQGGNRLRDRDTPD